MFSFLRNLMGRVLTPVPAGNERKSEIKPIAESMEELFSESPDFDMQFVGPNGRGFVVLYIETTIDKDLLTKTIIPAIMRGIGKGATGLTDLPPCLPLTTAAVNTSDEAASRLLAGNVVITCETSFTGISISIPNQTYRSIEEPYAEKNIRGAHDGFTESLNLNLTLVRRRLQSPLLKYRKFTLGRLTNTDVAVLFVDGVAVQSVIEELEDRLSEIDIDGILASGYIDQLISDHPDSPFPQHQATERVDKAVAALLEGKLVIIVSGTPVTVILPVNFFSFFQAMDDFSTKWVTGTFIRFLRFASLFLAIFLPGLYVAVLTYHYEVLPFNMLLSLAKARLQVPVPPILEAFAMELTIEVLREGGLRLPSPIAQTVSIVGGLVIGQAAVQAGLISTAMIIVVAVTAIATFVAPSYDMGLAIRICRFGIMLLAAVFGFMGIAIGALFLFTHQVSLTSLDEPYMRPLAPFKLNEIKDSLLRLSFRQMETRPSPSRSKKKRISTK